MLTHRLSGETITPKRLKIDEQTLCVARELIDCFLAARGGTQGELDSQLQELEGDSPDYRFKRGLAHLLKSACEFEVVSPLGPSLLRERVFSLSALSVPSSPQSCQTLDTLALQLSQELEQLIEQTRKQQAIVQAHAIQKVEETAAWWLFGSAFTSAVAAAIAGIISVTV